MSTINNKSNKLPKGRLLKLLFITCLITAGIKANAQYIGNTNYQICSNQSISVAIVNYCTSCTYKFGPTGGSLSTVTINALGGGVGTFSTPVIGAGSYTVTQNNVTLGTITVTVTSPPTVTLSTGGQQPFGGCHGSQITLSATGGNSYVWKKNGTQISTASSITATFSAGVTDTYTVTGTVSHCGTSSSQTRTVDIQGKGNLGGISITGGVSSRCKGGGTTDYNSSGSNVATWSNFSINQGGSIHPTTGLVTWNSSFSGTVTISRTASDGCGNSVTATKNVTVNPGPALHYVTASKTALCPSEVSTFGLSSSTSGTTYRLYRVGTSGALNTKSGSNTGGAITFGNHSTAGQYYVQASTSCGTVEMNNRISLSSVAGKTASIAITRSGDFSTDGNTGHMYACSGTTITLGFNATGLNLSSWRWKRNGSNYGNSNATSINVTQSGTYTLDLISYSIDTQNCYSGSISDPSVGVTIHSAVGNLSNKTANFTSCQTGRNPGVTAPSGQIVKWYTSSGSQISGTPNFDALGLGTHTYKVKASNNHGIRECISPGFATVTINVTEPTPELYGTAEYCQSNIPTTNKLFVRHADPGCSWQLRANNGTTVLDSNLDWDSNAQMYYFIFPPQATPGSKTVRAYKNGAQFGTFTQTMNANQTAAIAITRSGNFSTDGNTGDMYACAGTTITLGINATGLNLTSWQWKRNGSNFGSANANSINVTQSGTYTLSITNYSYDSQNCYVGSISNPSVGIHIHDAVGNLNNKTVNFTSCQTGRNPGVTAPSGQIVKWYTSSGSQINGTLNFDVLGVGTYTYKIKASNNHGIRECISPGFATVTVNVTEPTPSVYGTSQYCVSSVPASDKLYVRDVDTYCSWQLRANNGTTVIDNSLSWDATAQMHYFDFSPRTTVGSKTVRAYKEGVEFASFTQTIESQKTASAAIAFGGDFGFDAVNNKIHSCGDAALTLTKNTIGLNVAQWYWKKNGAKISGTDNDDTYTPTSDGVYELHLQTWSHDATNCYSGSISNPSVEVNKINVSDLETITTNFNECDGGRTIIVDQLSNGNAIPSSYVVQWYSNAESPLSSEPDWNSLGLGTHSFKIKGKVSNSFQTCYSPGFANVTVTIQELSVSITSPVSNAIVATGSSISINRTETNPYGTISYSLEGAGTSTSIPNPSSFLIPVNTAWGNDYRIKATTCNGNFYSPTFNIADYNRGSLILPEAGATSFREPVEVKWIRRPGDSYRFIYESVSTGERVETSLSSGSLTSGEVTYSYLWPVPDDLEGEYILTIEESSGSYAYTGDIYFYPDLKLRTPNKELSYETGRPLYIEWEGGDLHHGTSYVINLLKGGTYQTTLGTVVGEQKFTWEVPVNYDLGDDYQIQISQTLLSVLKTDESDQFFSLISCNNPSPPTASQDVNYIKIYTARAPDGACLSRLNDKNKVMESISYMDGMGRPLQTVIRNSTPDVTGISYDLVTEVEYDQYGRQIKELLPFGSAYNDGRFLDMNSASNVTQKQSFHEGLYPGQSSYAFSEVELESSPLARILEQGAPGQTWQLGNHSKEFKYLRNEVNEVRSFEIDAGLITSDYYPVNELAKLVSYDENSDPDRGEVIEYKDRQGRTILKEVLLENSGTKIYAQTYYLFDDLGNLRFVLQPEGVRLIEDVNESTITWASLNDETFRKNWMFTYEYDGLNRLIRKRTPGSEWVEMVYDDRDRLVLTRDGNRDLSDLNLGVQELTGNEAYSTPLYQVHGNGKIILSIGFSFKASGTNTFKAEVVPIPEDRGWIYTKYDKLNRPVMTGLLNDHRTHSEMISAMESFYSGSGIYYEERDPTSLTGYTNQSFPIVDREDVPLTIDDAYSITFYDNYSFTNESIPESGTEEVTGQLTGSKNRILGTNTWLSTVTFYDDRYRVVKTTTENYLEGQDRMKMYYLNDISSLVIRTETQHTGGETVTVVEENTYDHMDRPLTMSQSINGATPMVVSSKTYNGLNELAEKNLGGISSPVQSLDYTYNIRGWLTHVNNGTLLDAGDNDQFGFKLLYENASGVEQFNGNIGQIDWISLGGSNVPVTPQSFQYTYDEASRIHSADYLQGNRDLNSINYDHNGNILNLKRNGDDDLVYQYGNAGVRSNRLLSVSDQSNSDELFKDGSNSGDDYDYDDNGNMIIDRNNGISSVTYNYLNLPEVVEVTYNDVPSTVTYTYDAAGIKLRKSVMSGNSLTTYDYIGGMHFINESLSFIKNSEGRAINNNGEFDYEFNLIDHLGNVRVTVDQSGVVQQRDDYYPFGLTFNHYQKDPPENFYKFQGQEHQPETGWDQYEWRNADASIGRFFNIDPLAESFYYNSPYAFSENKVTVHIELEGLEAFFIHGTGGSPDAWKSDPELVTTIQNRMGNSISHTNIEWNGNNNSEDRAIVAERLVEYIRENRVEGEPITLVGHSHGGSIGIALTNLLRADSEFENTEINLVTLNTVYRDDYILDENPQNNPLTNHYNLYVPDDVVVKDAAGYNLTGKINEAGIGRTTGGPGAPPEGTLKRKLFGLFAGKKFYASEKGRAMGGEAGTGGLRHPGATNIEVSGVNNFWSHLGSPYSILRRVGEFVNARRNHRLWWRKFGQSEKTIRAINEIPRN